MSSRAAIPRSAAGYRRHSSTPERRSPRAAGYWCHIRHPSAQPRAAHRPPRPPGSAPAQSPACSETRSSRGSRPRRSARRRPSTPAADTGARRPAGSRYDWPATESAPAKAGADRDLAVVPLAELAAILTRHPDRVSAFLRKAGVVDNPGFNRAAAFDDRQDQLLYSAENPLIRPRRIGEEMQQRLVLGRDPGRRRYRRDRLHALALARQQQAQAIITQRLHPIRMPDHLGERLDIGREPFLPILAHAPFPQDNPFEDSSDSHPELTSF